MFREVDQIPSGYDKVCHHWLKSSGPTLVLCCCFHHSTKFFSSYSRTTEFFWLSNLPSLTMLSRCSAITRYDITHIH